MPKSEYSLKSDLNILLGIQTLTNFRMMLILWWTHVNVYKDQTIMLNISNNKSSPMAF